MNRQNESLASIINVGSTKDKGDESAITPFDIRNGVILTLKG